MKYLSSLISILWARTWPYLAGFATFGAILWVIGTIAILCGMPIMGSRPDMGNAITKIPELDNGLAVIMLTIIPILLVVGCVVAVKTAYKETRNFIQEVKDKVNEEIDSLAKTANLKKAKKPKKTQKK